MLPAHHARLQTLVQPGARPVAALRRLHAHPVAGTDTTSGRRHRVQLHFRVEGTAPQARQPAMLALAELVVLGARDEQRPADPLHRHGAPTTAWLRVTG